MARGLNKVILIGNLGVDPELRQTANGFSVLNFRIATTERVRESGTEQFIDKTEWHRLVLFGKRADSLQSMLKKGSRVYVEGALRTSSYEQDGVRKYSTDIIVNDILLLDSRNDSMSQNMSQNVPQQQSKPSPMLAQQEQQVAQPSSSNADDDVPF